MNIALSWEHKELARSVYYEKMSNNFKEFAIERSKEIGFKTAEEIVDIYGTIRSVEELEVIIQSYEGQVYFDNNTVVPDRLSEYYEEKGLIVCYNKQIERLQRDKQVELGHVSLLLLCLAHELFHHIELKKIGKVSKQVKFPYKMFGFLNFHREIEAAREIAAHAFVIRLFALTKSPAYIVYFRGRAASQKGVSLDEAVKTTVSCRT